MEPNVSHRDVRLDLIAAHLEAFEPDAGRARERLEHEIGEDLARLLVAALSGRSTRVCPAGPVAAVAA